MVSTEEIIERSIYMNLLAVALKNNLTLDPDEYLDDNGNPTPTSERDWNNDKRAMKKFVYIFGPGNNQERGIKEVPRITLELQGYYPGLLGMERFQLDDNGPNLRMLETGYTSKEITMDIHLVSKTQEDMRMLHSIMYKALPNKGYIKPYFNDKEEFMKGGLLPSENIYLEVGNWYDHRDNDHGLLEHVYSYKVTDGIVNEDVVSDIELVPIKDITCFIGNMEQKEPDMSVLHVGEGQPIPPKPTEINEGEPEPNLATPRMLMKSSRSNSRNILDELDTTLLTFLTDRGLEDEYINYINEQ